MEKGMDGVYDYVDKENEDELERDPMDTMGT